MTPDLIIRGAVLVRPPYGASARPCDVAIGGERVIAIVDASDEAVTWPAGTPTLDGRSAFLMPGLIEAHAHLAGPDAHPEPWLSSYLDHGVTTIREAGAHDDSAFAISRLWAGRPPRILTAGWMLNLKRASNLSAVARVAEEAVQVGATWLKAYALPPDGVRAVADVARRHGLPFAAHLGPAAIESVRMADLPAIEHIFSLLDYDLVDAETRRRARTPQSDEPIETWLLADPARPPLRDWVAELGARRAIVTPTLTVMAALVGRTAETFDSIAADEAPWASEDERRAWRRRLAGLGWWVARGPASRARRERVLARFGAVVQALHEAGAPIAAGTDMGEPFIEPGGGMTAELRALAAAGLQMPAILSAATSVPAALLGRSSDLGDIAVGGMADLLLLETDPRHSLDALGRIRGVIAGGRIVRTAGRSR